MFDTTWKLILLCSIINYPFSSFRERMGACWVKTRQRFSFKVCANFLSFPFECQSEWNLCAEKLELTVGFLSRRVVLGVEVHLEFIMKQFVDFNLRNVTQSGAPLWSHEKFRLVTQLASRDRLFSPEKEDRFYFYALMKVFAGKNLRICTSMSFVPHSARKKYFRAPS